MDEKINAAFKELEKHLIRIITSKKKGDPIRIWVPGCATGEPTAVEGAAAGRVGAGGGTDCGLRAAAKAAKLACRLGCA